MSYNCWTPRLSETRSRSPLICVRRETVCLQQCALFVRVIQIINKFQKKLRVVIVLSHISIIACVASFKLKCRAKFQLFVLLCCCQRSYYIKLLFEKPEGNTWNWKMLKWINSPKEYPFNVLTGMGGLIWIRQNNVYNYITMSWQINQQQYQTFFLFSQN